MKDAFLKGSRKDAACAAPRVCVHSWGSVSRPWSRRRLVRLSLARAGAGSSQGEFPTPVKITSKPFLQLNSARCSPCITLGTGTELRWQKGRSTVSGEGAETPTTPGPSEGRQRLSPSPAPPRAAQHRTASASGIPALRALTRKTLQGFCPRSRSHSSGAATRGSRVPPGRSPPVPAPGRGGGAAAELPEEPRTPARRGNPARAGWAPGLRETLPGPDGH